MGALAARQLKKCAAGWLAALTTAACLAESAPISAVIEPPPAIVPAEPVLHRLTRAQYHNALRDLLGPQVIVPGPIEPDESYAGLIAIGAGRTTISPWGVEQFESAAYDLAEQALAPGPLREALVPCTPEGTIDLACASDFVSRFGARAWRRPLSAEEVSVLAATATTGAAALDDFHAGLEIALAAILQSPSFLFRVELGEPDPDVPGERRYTAHEMASRLSFFFWNTTPDDALLAAADSGALLDDEGLRREVERLAGSSRAREGVRSFFSELFELHRLDSLTKDPSIFTHFSPELGALAREETLQVLERLIFVEDADYRDLFTTERTWVDRRLAAIYGVRASVRDGFGEVVLPREGLRRGLLGQVSFLALRAHPVSSSATLRGKFIRQVILCGEVPPPPVNVNTALPEPSGTARTLRERVGEHLANDTCRACHRLMDPIGLGLESFDGIGRLRTEDNGAPIDPTSELDGAAFADPWLLAEGLREHPSVPRCLVRNFYRYATGNVESAGEVEQIDWLTRRFVASGHRVRALLTDIALSPGFRRAKEPRP